MGDSHITKNDIIRLYQQPGHPIAFSSPQTIHRFFKGKVSLRVIREALEHINSYTLHREYKKPKFFNPYFAYQRRTFFQADLIDIRQLKNSNDNITYLLVVIDVFSRKIWVVPMTQKTAAATHSALLAWINAVKTDDIEGEGEKRFLLTDNGKEFVNMQVRRLLEQNNMHLSTTKNINKAAIVERANKSLQVLIYKYLTDREITRYIDALSSLVRTYNGRKHRGIQFLSPNEADLRENEVRVRTVHSDRVGKLLTDTKKQKAKFAVGNIVRIKTYATGVNPARRAYTRQFHGELFKVVEVKKRMPVIMYVLQSVERGDIIEGAFYANEITRVRNNVS